MRLAPLVIGGIFFMYVHTFIKTMDIYKKSDYTLTWNEYIREVTKFIHENDA